MNSLRDWKRSGPCCPRNHTRREWDLWDEVIEIQIEIHAEGTFPSNAYFLCDWFVWGRLRRFHFLAFPITFLVFLVLNVPSHRTQASSQTSPQGCSHHFRFCHFQTLLVGTLLPPADSWEIILNWKKIYPPGINGVTGIRGKVQGLSGYPAAICQTWWLMGKCLHGGHS